MSKSKTTMGEPHPPPAPHVGERKSFQKVEKLARDVLREKGFQDEEIDAVLKPPTRGKTSRRKSPEASAMPSRSPRT